MTLWKVTASLLVGAALVGCGNSDGSAASGASLSGSSGSPAASGGGKLVHQKITRDECTFEFDAPEQLKPAEKEDGFSTTVLSPNFEFSGSSGSSLYGLDQLAGLATMGTKDAVLVKETRNNINLVVTRSEKPPSSSVHFIGGHGEENDVGERRLGCSYLCWGLKEREADVVAMCKSVKITFTKEKQ